MTTRRPLLISAALAPLAAVATTETEDWVAQLSHAGEQSPVALRLQRDGAQGWTAQLSAPAIHVHQAPFGPARWQGDVLQIGAWQLQRSRDGERLLGTMPEFLVPRLRLPVVFRRGSLAPPPRPMPSLPAPRRLWQAALGAPLWADLLRVGDTLFAGDDAGRLHALDPARGALRWQAQTGGALRARPLLHAGDLLLPSDDGLLYAFDAASGRERWRLPLQAEPVRRIAPGQPGARFDRFGAGVCVHGGLLLTASHAGRLCAWELDTRRLRWQRELAGPLLGTPVVAEGRVLIGDFDGAVQAFDLASGRALWRFDTGAPVVSTVWVQDGLAFVGSRSYELFALRLADGREAWRRYHWFSWVESAVNGSADALYVGSSDGAHLSCWSPRSGALRWRRDVFGWAWGQPALDARRVAIGTSALGGTAVGHGASVWSFAPQSGEPQWRLPLPPPAEKQSYGVTGSLALGAQGEVFAGTLGGDLLALTDP